jgi:hypothetical protein
MTLATFHDSAGAEWAVDIKFGHLKALREKHGIDTKGKTKDFLQGIGDAIGDPERLYDLLLLLCAGQAAERGLDAEKFAMVLGGGALRAAASAVADALLDFCQGPTVGREMGESVRAAMTEMDARMGDGIRTATPTLISKLSAGNSRASSGATPTPAPSAS